MRLFVNLASVCDPRDGDVFCCIVDEVHDPPVTNPNAPVISVDSQLLASGGPRIVRQQQDLAVDPSENGIVQRV